MKTKTIIEELNHEDLVDFLSTALYGSNIFSCSYSKETYEKYCEVSDNDCIEDKMAKLLLRGDEISIGDMYAESDDDTNESTLAHEWDDVHEIMWYDVTLDDIKRGIQKCLDGAGNGDNAYLRSCAMDFINGEGDMDLPKAEAIMQVILWGELIYG